MDRITTGIAELDLVLAGGLPANSLNIIGGSPGTGKSILAQQIVFANARRDARALYLTTLSEPASKLLRYLQRFSFFDDTRLLDDPPTVAYRDIAQLVNGKGLESLPGIVEALVSEYRPAILVIDSFKALRDLGHTAPELRRTLFDVAGSLAARACTTVLVGEYTESEIRELPEFAIADGIVQLANRPSGMRDERYLRVVKLRGSGYRSGEHAFQITPRGLVVAPRLVTPEIPTAYVASTERISTGVAAFDAMLEGGLRRGSSTLIVGAAGTGKTMLGLHFLYAGVAAGEEGLLVSFQENPTLLRYLATRLGFDGKQLGEGGAITPLYVSPVEMNIDEVVQRIVSALETRPIKRVVIDSLGDLEAASPDPQRFRNYVYSLIQLFAVRGITSYATNESLVEADYASFTRIGSSHISDNVVALRYIVENDRGRAIGRSLCVVKCRGTAHDHHVRHMTISGTGIALEEALPG